MKRLKIRIRTLGRMGALAVGVAILPGAAVAQLVVSEDFTGTTLSNSWTAINGACLTAGNASNGSIPSCIGLPYYTNNGDLYQVGGQNGYLGDATAPSSNGAQTPDPVGNGALRLTNGSPNYHESGAIVSTAPFDASSGVQVTFKTLTYGGDSRGQGGDGADGISFFLLDASQYQAGSAVLGSWGGSLGYTCSNQNPPYDGQVGAYVGLGIDEYGNFLNGGPNGSGGYRDNTATGVPAVGWGSGTYQWNRIGLRGAGNVAWSWLNANYSSFYPSTFTTAQQQTAVQTTCETGVLWDYGDATPRNTGQAVADYVPIPGASAVLSGIQIANEAAATRAQATPIYYVLKITSAGLLSLSYSYGGGSLTQVLTNQSITASNGNLPAQLLFGFAGSTGGSDNVHEIMCFQAGPADQSDSSTTVNLPLDKLVTTAQVYLPSYHTSNWWGQLTAQTLYQSGTFSLAVNPIANWDGSCVLTGGNCTSMGNVAVSAQGPSGRTILSWNGGQGVGLEWGQLSAAEHTALDPGVSSAGPSNRLAYLRGDRSDEVPTSGATAAQIYRDRTGVLGDIIHSSPFWVGPPLNISYSAQWSDNLYPGAVSAENAASGQNNYQAFSNGYAARENVVYVGSNDGMLHGFRSGTMSNGSMDTSIYPNDGQEVLAYMPGAIVQSIHSAASSNDYSSPNYAHIFGVDAPPRGDDLFYSGAWHTWLAGGLGAGGRAIYALDVTDPTQFSEANASSLVMGEWTPSNISCANATNCGVHLNNTYGTPVIWRFHASNAQGNNKWGMVFGNGFPNLITGSISNTFTGSVGAYITGTIYNQYTGTVNHSTLTVTSGGLLSLHQPVSGTRIAANTTIASIGSPCTVTSCTYTLSKVSTATSNKAWSWTAAGTTLYASSGAALNVGDTIAGPGVAAGTAVTAIGSCAAGTCSYTVNNAQLVSPSETMRVNGTTLTAASGAGFVVGQTISGAGVAAGTTITAFGTGTGGVGTYYVSPAQIVPTTAMSNGVTALTVTAGSGITAGQSIAGPGVAAGTTISAFGSGTGGPGTYIVNVSQNVATTQMTAIDVSGSGVTGGTAGIYVLLVDPASGGQSIYYFDTGYGPNQDPLGQGRPNGIAYASPVDLDGDNTADYVYAGDLFGNVWRFDLTATNPLQWAASTFGNAGPTPLFSTTPSGSLTGQPVTSKPVVLLATRADNSRAVIINFGTGQEIPVTPVSPVSYAPGTQALYGVWDWDMDNWNSLAHASLASVSEGQYGTSIGMALQPGNLTTQTITVVTTTTPYEETISNNAVCWYGATGIPGCVTYNKFGWVDPLPGTGEQVIYNPTIWQGILQVNTTIPSASTIFSCTILLPSGYTMLFNPTTGGSFATSPFLDANGNPITAGGVPVSGIQTGGTGSITNISVNGQNFWLTDTSNGTPTTGGEQAVANVAGHRVTWSELR